MKPAALRSVALAVPLLAALLLAASLPRSPSVGAQQPPDAPLALVVTVDPPGAHLGERIRLTITITHPPDQLVTAGRLPAVEGLEVIEELPAVSEPLDDSMITEFTYIVAAFGLGEIPGTTVRISSLDSDGRTSEVAVAVPAITVLSTLTSGDTDLRPLKPQLAIAGGPPAWQRPALLAAVVAIALAGAAWVTWRRRRRHVQPELPQRPPKTVESGARARLDGVAGARLLPAGQYDRYYGQISHTVRSYLEQRFRFRATALTTAELERRMTNQGVERWQARLVSGLLERCDAAVYAHVYPDAASADHDLTVAYEIVELAKPGPRVTEP